MPARRKTAASDIRSWDRGDKLRLLEQFEAEEAAERAAALEAQGWRAWYAEIIGPEFVTNLAPHHIEAIEWHWNAMVLKRAGMTVEKSAYPAVWSRGHRKSNIVRAMVVADACVLGEGYCLYVSSTKSKVRSHAISVEALISTDKVAEYYPRLAKFRRSKVTGAQKAWTGEMMVSDSGYTYHFVGLMEGVAGANIEGQRVSLIVIDDADERDDSPVISDTKMRVLTRSVLPTRQRNTLVFIAQNYISRHGVIYRIHTGGERVLTNRVNTKPIPAANNLVTEPRTIDGIVHDVVLSCEPTWPYYDQQRIQEEIDTIGLSAFLVECQHDIDEDRAGAILPDYDEKVHVITWGAFNAVYGLPPTNRDVPQHWRKFCGYDHGSSSGHETAVSWLSVAGANGPLAGTIFFYKLMTGTVGQITGQIAHRILSYIVAPLQADPATYLDLGLLDRATADPTDVMAAKVRQKITEYLSRRTDYAMFHASHEQKALRDMLRMIYALPFLACNPRKAGGVEQWKHYMRPDMKEPHPFKPDEFGLCRFYMIVDDDQYDKARDDGGLAMARSELPEWRWRVPIMTVGGLMDERPQKQYDNVANCLVAGTLVKTEQGDIPIEDVKVGQRVWTRDGLRVVKWSGQTSPSESVFNVELSNGTVLTGTGHHPIWTDEGWMPLTCLQKGDKVLEWQDQNLLSTVALSTGVTLTQKAGAIETTLRPILPTVSKALSSFMSKCGKMLTGLSLTDTASITKTRTRRITLLKTLSVLPRLNTPNITWQDVAQLLQRGWHSLLRFSLYLWHGTALQRVELGTGSMPVKLLIMPSLINKSVSSVAMSSGQSGRRSSARFSAHGDSATRSSVFVRQVKPCGVQAVFNLEVEDCPEFFANGILVHNSIQMILTHFSLTATPLTPAERVEAAIPPHLRYDELLKNSPFERGLTPEQELSHLFAVQQAKKREAGRTGIVHFDEMTGRPIKHT